MNSIIEISIGRFCFVYLLLLLVLWIMKICQMQQSKLLLLGSIQMTLQLILAGLILTYIFENPHPLFTVLYVFIMIIFATHRVLSKNKHISTYFKGVTFVSLAASGVLILSYFILAIINESLFNPQYTIPLSGMVFGNVMTGLNLGIKTFHEKMASEHHKIETLLNFGAHPKDILKPFVNHSLEIALLPTLNSMVGMGIVSLPGMMTGQILAGTLPMTAIFYQISIMIVICTVVTLSVFCSLYFGHKSYYNQHGQIIY